MIWDLHLKAAQRFSLNDNFKAEKKKTGTMLHCFKVTGTIKLQFPV